MKITAQQIATIAAETLIRMVENGNGWYFETNGNLSPDYPDQQSAIKAALELAQKPVSAQPTVKRYTATQIAELAGVGRQYIKDEFRRWREDRDAGKPEDERRGIPNMRVGRQDEAIDSDVQNWLKKRE